MTAREAIAAILADLPAPGDPVMLADGGRTLVVACSGWTWPLGEPEPTRVRAQLADGTECRVLRARDGEGARFWIAERREP